jgi:hypothetical protein
MELVKTIFSLITVVMTLVSVGYLPTATRTMLKLAVEAQENQFSLAKWNRQLNAEVRVRPAKKGSRQ